MALTPENDTGLANADSYVSLATFRAYITSRGLDDSYDRIDSEAEADLRAGFAKVNNYGAWKSAPLQNLQAGEFPRVDLSDGMGRVFNVVPQRVKDAQMQAAFLAGNGVDLYTVAERGGQVQSEAVGPLSTSYFAGAPATTYFQAIDDLLKPFLRDGECPRRPVPSYTEYDTDPVFSVGMDDNTAEQG